MPGTTTDTSTAEDPSYTYTAAGTYAATLTVTDADGGVTTKSLSDQGRLGVAVRRA